MTVTQNEWRERNILVTDVSVLSYSTARYYVVTSNPRSGTLCRTVSSP